jgi:thiol:disulfide interchange protein
VKSRALLAAVAVLAGLLFAGGISTAAAVTTNVWHTTPADCERVQEKAKKEDKAFILFFYVDWCGYCKRLKKEFLEKPEVEQALAKYYRVKINPETGAEEQALAKKYGVHGFPNFLVIQPDGGKVRIHPFKQGGKVWTVEEFISNLEAAMAAKG